MNCLFSPSKAISKSSVDTFLLQSFLEQWKQYLNSRFPPSPLVLYRLPFCVIFFWRQANFIYFLNTRLFCLKPERNVFKRKAFLSNSVIALHRAILANWRKNVHSQLSSEISKGRVTECLCYRGVHMFFYMYIYVCFCVYMCACKFHDSRVFKFCVLFSEVSQAPNIGPNP